MKKPLKLLALLMVVLMLVPSVLVACDKGDGDETTTTPPTTTTPDPNAGTTTPEPTTTPEETTDAVIDMKGFEFRMSANGYKGILPTNVEATLSDQYWDIIDQVESMFNCVIDIHSSTNKLDHLLQNAAAGFLEDHFACCRQNRWTPLSQRGYVHDMESLVQYGLQLTNPDYFDQMYTGMARVHGKTYALDVSGRFHGQHLGFMYAINVSILNETTYTVDKVYQMVREKKWDYATFLDIAKQATQASDGSQIADRYGVACDANNSEFWSNGAQLIRYDEETYLYYSNLHDAKLLPAIEFFETFTSDTYSLSYAEVPKNGDRRKYFWAGNAAMVGVYGSIFSSGELNSLDGEYAVVPVPMGPDATDYICIVPDLDSFMTPIANGLANNNLRYSTMIMNQLGKNFTSLEGYKEFNYYQRFRENQDVLDIVFGYIYPNSSMNMHKLADEVQDPIDDFAAAIKVNRESIATAAETYHQILQTALNELFGQPADTGF